MSWQGGGVDEGRHGRHSEVFLGVGVTEVDFFFDFCDLYGKMVVESTHKYAPTR